MTNAYQQYLKSLTCLEFIVVSKVHVRPTVAVISCHDEFHFSKSHFIEYKNTILTSDAVPTLNKSKILTVSFW